MKYLICDSVSKGNNKLALLLLTALAMQSSYALDYPEVGDAVKGSKAWSENCARCHSMRSPTDLRDDQWVTTVFHMRVRAGLTGQEARDILTFLQNANARVITVDSIQVESKTVGLTSGSGKQIYESNCLACHGSNGKGSVPGVPDFTDRNGRLSKSDNDLLRNIINGIQSPGSSLPMPPRGGNSQLSDADLAATLKYMKISF